jgi:3-oxoadipate enol-lactonase
MPYVEVNGGLLHYHLDDYTEPWLSRSVVLLHHAAGGNLHRWRSWVPCLAPHYKVLRFDMRGHAGSSDPPEGVFSLSNLAKDIPAIMDKLGINKVHLVGASAGGIVSLQFAHDFAERLHSLSLVASTPKLSQMGEGVDAGVWRNILETKGTKAWLLADTEKRFHSDTDPRIVEWYAEEGSKTSSRMVLALQECLLKEDLFPLIPQIKVPSLILGAANDEITPGSVQRQMADLIPQAELMIYENVGHNMKVEIPDILANRVSDFIAKVEDSETFE